MSTTPKARRLVPVSLFADSKSAPDAVEPATFKFYSFSTYPGNIYQARHRRLVYRTDDMTEYVGLAFDADWQVIARVEAATAFEAERKMAAELREYFRPTPDMTSGKTAA